MRKVVIANTHMTENIYMKTAINWYHSAWGTKKTYAALFPRKKNMLHNCTAVFMGISQISISLPKNCSAS